MASAELQKVLGIMQERRDAAQGAPPPDIAAMRANMERTAFPVSPETTVTDLEVAGVPAEWVCAPSAVISIVPSCPSSDGFA